MCMQQKVLLGFSTFLGQFDHAESEKIGSVIPTRGEHAENRARSRARFRDYTHTHIVACEGRTKLRLSLK